MKLLGATLAGTVEDIDISTCPSVIDAGQVACLGKPNSNIFHKDGIVYKCSAAGVVEGDKVYENDEYIGIAYYSRGWKVHLENGFSKELCISQHIKMKSSKRDYTVFKRVNQIPERVGILVYANEVESQLFDMIMVKSNEIIFLGQKRRAFTDMVFLSTGIYGENKIAYYFNQCIKGGILTLNDKLQFVIQSTSQKILTMEDLK